MSALSHDIVVLEPVLGPLLAVDLHPLHVVALIQAGGRDPQGAVPVDCHVEVGEPGR